MFGLFFVSLVSIEVEASFLDSLRGRQVSAGNVEALTSASPVRNSQTLSLLQANVSSFPVLQNKSKKEEEKEEVVISHNSGFNNIVSENALLATALPSSILDGDTDSESSFDQTSVYVVRRGDSISQIALMFEVSVNTILWANNLDRSDKIKEGDILLILPVDGVKHDVKKGETLKIIAQKYKVDVADIASFNGLTVSSKLAIGEELIIPEGEIPVDGPINTKASIKIAPVKISAKNLAGYYINPVPGYIKTQGTHGNNAVDLAAPIGTPVYAAAAGTISLARMGYNGGYGNMVIIEHSNGTKTLYSHLSNLASQTGQSVSQGDLIGYVGNSGRVRAAKGGNGAHLHFEVHGAKNPGVDRSWK